MRLIKNAIITVFAVLLVLSLSRNIFDYKDKIAFYDDYKSEYEKELEQNKQLKSELKQSTDSYYVEREIREQLQLLKENEVAVILPEITITPTPTEAPPKPPYEQWRDLLLNNE